MTTFSLVGGLLLVIVLYTFGTVLAFFAGRRYERRQPAGTLRPDGPSFRFEGLIVDGYSYRMTPTVGKTLTIRQLDQITLADGSLRCRLIVTVGDRLVESWWVVWPPVLQYTPPVANQPAPAPSTFRRYQ